MADDSGSVVVERTRGPVAGIRLGVIGLVVAGVWAVLVRVSGHLLWPVAVDRITGVHRAVMAPLSSYLLWWLILPVGAGIVALVMGVRARASRSDVTARRARKWGIVAVGVDLVLVFHIVVDTIDWYTQIRSFCNADETSDSPSCHVGENQGQVQALAALGYAFPSAILKSEEYPQGRTVTEEDGDRSFYTRGSWFEITVTADENASGQTFAACQLYWNGAFVDHDWSFDGTVTCRYHDQGPSSPDKQE